MIAKASVRSVPTMQDIRHTLSLKRICELCRGVLYSRPVERECRKRPERHPNNLASDLTDTTVCGTIPWLPRTVSLHREPDPTTHELSDTPSPRASRSVAAPGARPLPPGFFSPARGAPSQLNRESCLCVVWVV
jgi:hypothetical protein